MISTHYSRFVSSSKKGFACKTIRFSIQGKLSQSVQKASSKRAVSKRAQVEQKGQGKWKLLEDLGFKKSQYDEDIMKLCIPTMLALAADPLMAIVDTAFVGHLGAEPLGALGVNTALFAFVFVVFNFLSTATTPLIASSLAENNKRRSGVLCAQGLTAASCFGIILFFTLLLNADTCLHWMGIAPEQDQQMYAYAKDFLLTRAWAAPAVLLITVSQGIFRGGKDTQTPLAVTIGANGVNLFLDVVLILGMGLGLRGAGIATNSAEWIAAIVFMGILYSKREEFGIGKQSFGGVDMKEYIPFLSAGGAVLLRTALLLGTKTLATGTIARMGTIQVASHQVLYQIWIISSLLIDSLAVAGQALVAIELGGGSKVKAKEVSDRLLQLGIALGSILSLFFSTLGSHNVSALFTEDPNVISFVDQVFPLAVCMLPVNAIAFVLDGILLGASDFGFLASAMAGVTLFTVVVLGLAENAGYGLVGVWWSLAFLMFGRVGVLGLRYISNDGPFGDNDCSNLQNLENDDDFNFDQTLNDQINQENNKQICSNGKTERQFLKLNGSQQFIGRQLILQQSNDQCQSQSDSQNQISSGDVVVLNKFKEGVDTKGRNRQNGRISNVR